MVVPGGSGCFFIMSEVGTPVLFSVSAGVAFSGYRGTSLIRKRPPVAFCIQAKKGAGLSRGRVYALALSVSC